MPRSARQGRSSRARPAPARARGRRTGRKAAKRAKPRIGISGSYGGLNLGDEAILDSIVHSLKSGAELVIFSRDVGDTGRRHPRARAVPVRELTKEQSREIVRDLDVLVFGGGGLLFDDEVELFLREVQIAHELHVPVMVYGISAGPLLVPHNRRVVRDALNPCAAITVRDRHGVQLLQDLGVDKPVQLTADPALLLRAERRRGGLAREAPRGSRHLVGFSVREPGGAAPDLHIDHYHALVANAADYVIDRFNADVVFVPMERRQVDIQHSHAVAAKMQHAARATILKDEYTPAQLLTLLNGFDFAVGMRLHFLIFAALAGVPFVSLPYATKVSGFIEDLELPAPPLSDLNAGTLLAHIDRSWDFRTGIRERIAKNLPALQQRAARNHEVLMQLLQTLPPKPCPP